MKSARPVMSYLHLAILASIGVTGWALLIALSVWPPEGLRPWQVSWELLVCLGLAIGARLLAFRVFDRVRIALDSAFYIAAAFVFGPLPAAWLPLITLALDGAVQLVRTYGIRAHERQPLPLAMAQVLHNAAVPALVLLGMGVLFAVDHQVPYRDLTLTWQLPLFSVCFLGVHYFLAGGTHWLQGTTPTALLRGFFQQVFTAELALVPLSLAMVLGYTHQGAGLFLLLGATCLMFNWIFRRAVIARETLQQRVEELSTLNKVGRIISGTLERDILMATIASETLRLVRHTSRFMIGLVDEASGVVQYELFDEEGRAYKQVAAPRDAGLSGWVMHTRQPLLLGDVQRQFALYSKDVQYNDPRFHSWLGVPLIIYNEVMGVISVQSQQRYAYTNNHQRFLSMIADQAAVALENARLYELATVDGLTGLFVRRYFDQRIREELQRSARHQVPFVLGLLDLDNFKALNDTFGHQAGDQVLRAAAVALRSNMRSFDLAARYGGEELAFILPRTSLQEAVKVAERIRLDIEKMVLPFSGRSVRVTASIGLAGYPESEVTDVPELVARADQALYRAKAQGKNCVVVAGQAPALMPAVGDGLHERPSGVL